MDQSLYTLGEARERPVRHRVRDGGIDGLIGVKFGHAPLPHFSAPVRSIDSEIQ